ncbi:MAG: thioredoxin domain-containing protein [Polyangiaceae bacterium]
MNRWLSLGAASLLTLFVDLGCASKQAAATRDSAGTEQPATVHVAEEKPGGGATSSATSAAPREPVSAQPATAGDPKRGAPAADSAKADVSSAMHELFAPCSNEAVPLDQCIAEHRACTSCAPAADLVSTLVRRGTSNKDVRTFYTARFASPEAIDFGTSPVLGPSGAPVVIVEWLDYECPHCAAMEPVLDMLMERFPNQILRVEKLYPLKSHTHAGPAALAALAADRQGKFWPMHKLMLENQDKLEGSDLESYATKLGLDMKRFKQDMASKRVADLLADDVSQADKLGLDGTPFLWVNGRQLPFELMSAFLDDFEEWVRGDIVIAGATPHSPSPRYAALRHALE